MSKLKTVMFYPGQGSQKPGMGKKFYAPNNWCDNMWQEANEILGYNLKEILFRGTKKDLKNTEITQPAVYMTEMFTHKALNRRGVNPDIVAGHSLGEYGAVVASGAMDWKTGLNLVDFRGKLFSKISQKNPGSMIVVIGMKEKLLEAALADIDGVAEIVNYNSPGQLVVSVQKNIVGKTIKAIKKAGARLVKELEVSGGFHSALMDEAVPEMAKKVDKITLKDPDKVIYANCTGLPLSTGDEIKQELIKQVNSPVRWISTVENIYNDIGDAVYLEVGPGKVLKGLVRRINRNIKLQGITTPDDINKISSGG